VVALRNLAGVLLDQNDLDKAKPALDYYLAEHPQDAGAYALMGAYYAQTEEYGKALEFLDKAIEKDPRRPLPYGWISTILGEVYADYPRAIERLKKGLGLNPKDPILLNNLAYSYLMLGDTGSARRVLDGVDEAEYNVFLTATRGLLLLKEGDKQEGSRLYNLAARLARTSDLRNLVMQKKNLELARDAARRGDLAGAHKHAARVVELSTKHFQCYRHQAQTLLRQLAEGEGVPGQ
jgi:tetratricopeptide (TPR) repeat protein